MALPREPRQKMINMMYLVLTALLALNVSSEILNAFKTVNDTLEKSNVTITNSTATIMQSLQQKLNDPSTAEKAKIWYPRAQQVEQYASELNKYIQGLKDDILIKAGGDPKNPEQSYKEDNLDIATRMMVDKGEGKVLLQKLTDFKNNILGINDSIKTEFATTLPIDLSVPKTQSKSNKKWETAYFHMVPTVAALTILSKFQNDVKTSENKVVAFCHTKVGEVVVRQDAFAAIAVADANYILPGQKINITAGVGGFSTAVKPQISIGGSNVPVGTDGTAQLEIQGTSLGSHSIPVHIEYTDQDGKKQSINKTIEYTVGQSNAAVQLDKMNVLFIGVDNPITISGSGSVEQLQVSASGGGAVISGSGARRTVRVNQITDDCVISIRTPDGKLTPVRFRVRSIPDPTPYVGSNESGDVTAAAFKSQAGVRAYVKDFYYETQFNVVSFRIVGDGAGFDEGVEEKNNTGAAWNEARSIINKARQGSYIYIDDIRAVGPDGRTRKLTPLIFNLK
ncbi:MAG: gliding motility protein GldM [Bacteroidetes bacterium]|nr:gliding motility protein GldM [Bacteroidota bacterium]MBS1633106.1 gliding motility protein GldM [Bacteroidota bacterium]